VRLQREAASLARNLLAAHVAMSGGRTV